MSDRCTGAADEDAIDPAPRRRRARRATAPATRDGVPIEAEAVIGQTRDDQDLALPAAGDEDRLEWLRRQRPPHWG